MPDAIAPFLAACAGVLDAAGIVREPAALAAYTSDFWRYVEGASPAALRPASTAQVAAVVGLAAAHGVALVPQGGNTGLVGANVPDRGGRQVVLSLARLDRIERIDTAGDCLVAGAGCTLAAVQEAARSRGRLFPLSFGSEGTCRIGGNLGTNAGGMSVLRYGMMRDLVLGLEVVLADGRVWNGLHSLRKDNTGYDLKQLFIGAEGTLGVITAASLRLFARPRERVTLFLAVPDPEAALALLGRARDAFGELVSSFELIDGFCVEAACKHLPGVRMPLATASPWYVLTEIAWSLPEGLEAVADGFLEAAAGAGLVADGTRAQSEAQRAMLWRMREEISEATRHEGAIVRNDVSVPVARVPELVARAAATLRERFPDARPIPFGHVGDGNLHYNLLLPFGTPDLETLRADIQHAVFDLVEALEGSISAEHGIGRLKRDELRARKPPIETELMRRLKATLDPGNILNPGVIV